VGIDKKKTRQDQQDGQDLTTEEKGKRKKALGPALRALRTAALEG
jgi:hypothetical protein